MRFCSCSESSRPSPAIALGRGTLPFVSALRGATWVPFESSGIAGVLYPARRSTCSGRLAARLLAGQQVLRPRGGRPGGTPDAIRIALRQRGEQLGVLRLAQLLGDRPEGGADHGVAVARA